MSTNAFVVGNAAWDETWLVADLPVSGASIHAKPTISGLGGKGANQAIVLARAGTHVSFATCLGKDARGNEIAQLLELEGMDTCFLSDRETPTDRSLVLVTPKGENTILTTRDAIAGFSEEDSPLAIAIAEPDGLCVLQGNLSMAATVSVFEAAKDFNMVIAFNPSPFDPGFIDLVAQTDILFVNAGEAEALTGLEPKAAAAKLAGQGPARVVVTLGEEGALLAIEGKIEVIEPVPVESVDPTGAGDVFMATALAHGLQHGGLPDAKSLSIAARAAALCVGRAGTYQSLPSADELKSLMNES